MGTGFTVEGGRGMRGRRGGRGWSLGRVPIEKRFHFFPVIFPAMMGRGGRGKRGGEGGRSREKLGIALSVLVLSAGEGCPFKYLSGCMLVGGK